LRIPPRFQVNSVDAALDAAISGLGIARLFSYQAEAALTDGRLVGVLEDFEPAPAPIHLVRPAGRPPAKVAAFISSASAVLRSKFAG
jgi:DNA-binding transcriptional LysR family regulator